MAQNRKIGLSLWGIILLGISEVGDATDTNSGDVLTYSYSNLGGGGLPTWFSFLSSTTGAFDYLGVLLEADAGIHTIRQTVIDDNSHGSAVGT